MELLPHENISELMLQPKEDYDINDSDREGRTALIRASEHGDARVVPLLFERRAEVNAQGGLYVHSKQH